MSDGDRASLIPNGLDLAWTRPEVPSLASFHDDRDIGRHATRFQEQPPEVEAAWVKAVGWPSGWSWLFGFLVERGGG